jgi:hypothetical protein
MPQSESPVPSPSIPDEPEAAVQDDLTALAPGSVASLFSAAMRPGDSVKSVKACQRLHRAALPPPGPWLAIVSNDKREDLRLQLAVRFNCLFLLPTACVSTNNHLLRRAPTPIQTVPLPISLATNIEGSLSLLIWTNAPSHQSRLQISETHCGPPACPRAKAKKKERNG